MKEDFLKEAKKHLPEDIQILPISAVAHQGLEPLKEALWKHVDEVRHTDESIVYPEEEME